MAPVVERWKNQRPRPDASTDQQMLDRVLDFFGIVPTIG
jgi:hypothetical protein